MRRWPRVILAAIVWTLAAGVSSAEPVSRFESRRPESDAELRYWLENMVWQHRFSIEEIQAATGMSRVEIDNALGRFNIHPDNAPTRATAGTPRIAPWPGGRLLSDWGGEVEQTRQRETKVTVFTPWDPAAYVVLDVPEAIWSNLGLVYLAHVDVPTIWTAKGVKLERREWSRCRDGALKLTRKLPNGIAYHAEIRPDRESVRMKLTLTNGTRFPLSDLRVQNCVFLKGLPGFENRAHPRVVSAKPYMAYGTADGRRWVITAWVPCDRLWNNPRNPCFHSDPKFDDCPPGESRSVFGWLSFFEGKDTAGEFRRIDRESWRGASR
jgi:hypothetical protein